MLAVKNLKTTIDGPSSAKASEGKKEILKGVDLEVKPGEIHVLMGPNGSGKSTLAQVIAGHPQYKIESGELRFENEKLNKLTPDKRAKLGIFLGFQHPVELPGVSVFAVLRKAKTVSGIQYQVSSKKKIQNTKYKIPNTKSISEFRQQLLEHASSLKLSDDFIRRSLNEGFSGGEKKRSEILQMLALKPKLVILDEIDSGLDVDGLKIVAGAIRQFAVSNPQSAIILITHYARILKHLKPDFVHVMVDGKIVKSGQERLAVQIEKLGYSSLQAEVQILK